MDNPGKYEKKSTVMEILRQIFSLEPTVYAAQACYFIILSAFPTLVLLLGLLRYTALAPEDLMDLLGTFLPETFHVYAWRLIYSAYENTSRAVVSLSAVAALWSAGKGIHGVMKGLNNIYGVRERRGWLQTRIMCMLYMIMFILVLLLTLVIHVFGNTIAEFLRHYDSNSIFFWMDLINIRFYLLVAAQTMLFCVMFMYLPSRNNGFRESLPGALLASLGWTGVSGLFSVYVKNFSGYANIFGSVYAVALMMLWLYACVSIVFAGAILNRILRDFCSK